MIVQMRSKIKGLSLVEVLISSAIAIIIFSMAINMYINARNRYDEYKDGIESDLKQLLVKRVIYNFVKSAGISCRFGDKNQTYYDITSDSLDSYFTNPSSVIIGSLPFANGSSFSTSMEAGCSGECYQDSTDYIMIKRDTSHTSLVANNNANITLNAKSVLDVDINDYLALCSKDYINIVKASSVDGLINTITLAEAASGSIYYTGDYVGNYSLEVLYIRNTGDKDSEGNDIYSLYVYIRDNSSNISYELIRGVENLQLEYPIVSGSSITWNPVSSDVGVDNLSYPALRASFSINGDDFNKTITL